MEQGVLALFGSKRDKLKFRDKSRLRAESELKGLLGLNCLMRESSSLVKARWGREFQSLKRAQV